MSANQPTSFRYPFDNAIENAEGTHPAVKDAIRYAYTGLKDLNDAVRKLNTKVNTNSAAVTNVTDVIAGSGGGVTPPPPPPATFGFVNLQPDLTPGAYTLSQSDLAGLILVQSSIAFALTLNSGLMVPFFTTVYNLGSGTITATPSLGNVNNGASVTILTNQFSVIYFDGTNWWATALPTGVVFADPEVPAGTVNGTTGSDGNPTFTLSAVPNPAAQFPLTKNGINMYQGTAYTLSGNTITYLAPYIPVTGDLHETLAYRTA